MVDIGDLHDVPSRVEHDPAQVRSHLEKALVPDVEFIDPSITTHGIDEFEANVHGVHGQLPGAHYERTSGVDSPEVDEDGLVVRVLGFFGPLPDQA